VTPSDPPSAPRKPPSLAEVAAKAGVSKATASLVLNRRAGPSASTRKRVIAAADTLGFKPNPLVTAFQAHVRSGRAVRYEANIGWLNDYPERTFWRHTPWWDGYFVGARRRAEALGFFLEELHLSDYSDEGDPRRALRRLARVLRNRGIRGLLLPWLRHPVISEEAWEDLAVAMIGRNTLPGAQSVGPSDPPFFHHVSPDVFHNFRLAWSRLAGLGRRRIGLVLSRENETLGDQQQRACLLVIQDSCPLAERVCPLFLPADTPMSTDAGPLADWLAAERPDAVLLYNDGLRVALQRSFGNRILGVQLNRIAQHARAVGVDNRHAEIGSAAIDLVAAQINRNERGRPPTPHEVLIKGCWVAPPESGSGGTRATAARPRGSPPR
jgi:DNA-binding LacI/PurR family transcriptional regulator